MAEFTDRTWEKNTVTHKYAKRMTVTNKCYQLSSKPVSFSVLYSMKTTNTNTNEVGSPPSLPKWSHTSKHVDKHALQQIQMEDIPSQLILVTQELLSFACQYTVDLCPCALDSFTYTTVSSC